MQFVDLVLIHLLKDIYLWDNCGNVNADLLSDNIKKLLLIFRSNNGIVIFSKGELTY